MDSAAQYREQESVSFDCVDMRSNQRCVSSERKREIEFAKLLSLSARQGAGGKVEMKNDKSNCNISKVLSLFSGKFSFCTICIPTLN